jgi:hypothetical protein
MYAISCLILFIGTPVQRIFFPTQGRLSTVIDECANTVFAISELCVFVIFFFQIITSRNSKRLLLLLSGVCLISIVFFGAQVYNIETTRSEIMTASVIVNIVEFAVFLVGILTYFVELFTRPPTRDLGRSPDFWISSGLFIYILASLPLLLFGEYIWIERRSLYFLLFSLHFLSLSLLLLTISKAFLCQELLTT